MANSTEPDGSDGKQQRRRRQNQQSQVLDAEPVAEQMAVAEINVGRRLRKLRGDKALSIRALAERSGLNANTLSLIENGKTSPSVSTLQLIALALEVPVTAFFETDAPINKIAFQKNCKRIRVAFSHGYMEDLGAGLTSRGAEPFIVTLEPGADSGSNPIVHTGREFVYCLEGHLAYLIEDDFYVLEPGDSLFFEAYLPHRWQNVGETPSRSLLALCPADENDHPTEHHFKPD